MSRFRRTSFAVAVVLLSSLSLSGTALGQTTETPDDPTPDMLDVGGVPEAADPAPLDQLLEGLAPIHSDLPGLADGTAASLIGGGSCTPTAFPPAKDGAIVVGTGDWTCAGPAPTQAIRVCIDRMTGGQWLEKRCQTKVGRAASSLSTEVRATCDAGTWTYRTRLIGAALDEQGQPTEAAVASAEATLSCMTGPLDEAQLTEYLLLHNDTLYIAECDGQYLIISGHTLDVLEASTGEEFDTYCALLLGGEDEDQGLIADPALDFPSVLDLVPPSQFTGSSICDGSNSKVGGPGNDTLIGTEGRDTISGRGGHDLIRGLGQEDSLCGDEGDDTIEGGNGQDYFDGGEGNDRIYSESGNSIMTGRDGDDSLYGGPDFDWMEGWLGGDYLDGSGGDDILDGGPGYDQMVGGAGGDWMYGGTGVDTINGLTGDDRLVGESDGDVLDGGDGRDDIKGQVGVDTIRGGPSGDVLFGGGAGDRIFAESGDDCHTTPAQFGCAGSHASDAGVYDGRGRDELDGGLGYDELYVCADGVAEGSKTNFELIMAKAQEHCDGPNLVSLFGAVVSVVGDFLPGEVA